MSSSSATNNAQPSTYSTAEVTISLDKHDDKDVKKGRHVVDDNNDGVNDKNNNNKNNDDDTNNNNNSNILETKDKQTIVLFRPLSEFPEESFFVEQEVVPALKIAARRTAPLRKQLRHVLLNRRRTPDVQKVADNNKYRLLLLNNDPAALHDPVVVELLEAHHSDNNDELFCQATTFELQRTYSDFTVEQVLKRILPVSAAAAAATKLSSSLAQTNTNDDDEKRMDDDAAAAAADTTTNQKQPTTDVTTASIVELPGMSFELVGTIAHVNLQDMWLPYKYWIGKVILDKNQPTIKTVVNKLNAVENEFRVLDLEVIASTTTTTTNNNISSNNWAITVVKEEKCRFELDYTKVYWNSRLAGEHKRIVQMLQQEAEVKSESKTKQPRVAEAVTDNNDDDDEYDLIVADLMAGIGPFAIPLTANTTAAAADTAAATRKRKGTAAATAVDVPPPPLPKIRVYANDLNPASYHYLQRNAVLNKCSKDCLKMFNMDARAFVRYLQIGEKNEKQPSQKSSNHPKRIDYFIMNLPQLAPEFLDAFRGYQFCSTKTTPKTINNNDTNDHSTTTTTQHHYRRRPRLLVYCFALKTLAEQNYPDAVERCARALGMISNDEKDENETNNNNDQPPPPPPPPKKVTHCRRLLSVEQDELVVRTVRNVAPTKNMVCLSFLLPILWNENGESARATVAVQQKHQTVTSLEEEENPQQGAAAVAEAAKEEEKEETAAAAVPAETVDEKRETRDTAAISTTTNEDNKNNGTRPSSSPLAKRMKPTEE